MNGHGAVEIGFGGFGIQGYGKALNDFRCIKADHVHAEHLVCFCIHDQFHQAAFIAASEGVFHGAEVALVDGSFVAFIERFFFAEPYRAYGRGGKDGCGDVIVAYTARGLAGKKIVGERVSFLDGDGGEVSVVCDIADGIDVRD